MRDRGYLGRVEYLLFFQTNKAKHTHRNCRSFYNHPSKHKLLERMAAGGGTHIPPLNASQTEFTPCNIARLRIPSYALGACAASVCPFDEIIALVEKI